MIFRVPLRRFLHLTDNIKTPEKRFGILQWVLSRPMYRFQRFDLTQVPEKNRAQALQLELAQWTPYLKSDYFVGWHGHYALAWCWDADKVQQAIVAQGLKLKQTRILPESVLRTPLENGLSLSPCLEGYEGLQWHDAQLVRCRWWPQLPSSDEWLMFQRDAGISPSQQQTQQPSPSASALNMEPWVSEVASTIGQAQRIERLIIAATAMLLLFPTIWYSISLYKVRVSSAQLSEQRLRLQNEVEPIALARRQALDHLARINELRTLESHPRQLVLMERLAQVLPPDNTYVRDWDFQQGKLTVTIKSDKNIATTNLIGILQQAGPFQEVKALPGKDSKSVTFEMTVVSDTRV